VALGLLDVLSRAPVAVQLAHLTLADAVWVTLVLTAAAALAEAPAVDGGHAPMRGTEFPSSDDSLRAHQSS
jgi:hypothetical protein